MWGRRRRGRDLGAEDGASDADFEIARRRGLSGKGSRLEALVIRWAVAERIDLSKSKERKYHKW